MTILRPRLRNASSRSRVASVSNENAGSPQILAAAVGVKDDLDVVADPAERLVDGVVDGLVDEVVQAVHARVADVHRGALADGLPPLQDPDVARPVGFSAPPASPP